jgi:hypothetical protein
MHPVLRIRIQDPVPLGPMDPGSGIGKKSDPDHIYESLEFFLFFWVKLLKFFDADPGWKKI